MEFIQSLFSLAWIATLIAFIVFWWKKRKARLAAGENYADDENYKHISKIKKIIGIACIFSFVIAGAIPSTPKTPEEQIQNEANLLINDFVSNYKKDTDGRADCELLKIYPVQFISDDKAIVKYSFKLTFYNSDKKTVFTTKNEQSEFDFKKYGNQWKSVIIDDDGEWLTYEELEKKYSK